jgi:hypothetical protein
LDNSPLNGECVVGGSGARAKSFVLYLTRVRNLLKERRKNAKSAAKRKI